MRFDSIALTAALLASSFALPVAFAQGATTATGLSPEALQQVRDIYTLKASLTPAEHKLSTNLLLLSRMSQGKLPASLVKFVKLPARNAAGRFDVEVHGHLSTDLMKSAALDVDTATVSPGRGPRDVFALTWSPGNC